MHHMLIYHSEGRKSDIDVVEIMSKRRQSIAFLFECDVVVNGSKIQMFVL